MGVSNLASTGIEATISSLDNFSSWKLFSYSELICPYVSLFLLSADELLFSTINSLKIFTQLLLASSHRQHGVS